MKESEFGYKGHRNSYTELNEVYSAPMVGVPTEKYFGIMDHYRITSF